MMSEADAMAILEKLLGPKAEIQSHGEKHVYVGHNLQWREHAIPRPGKKPNLEQDAALRNAIKSCGGPSKPKPDLTYGYTNTTFSETEMDTIRSLSPVETISSDQPWFPFLISEWKASKTAGTDYAALLQTRRDGPTAVNALWNFYQSCGIPSPPTDWTAIFSACITSGAMEIYLSWRRVATADGEVTWETDLVESGFLDKERDVFALRSVLLEITKWACTVRLDQIRAALAARFSTPTAVLEAVTVGRDGLAEITREATSVYEAVYSSVEDQPQESTLYVLFPFYLCHLTNSSTLDTIQFHLLLLHPLPRLHLGASE